MRRQAELVHQRALQSDVVITTALIPGRPAPVLLKDVAKVKIGIAPRLGEFGFMNNDDAVEGVIMMRTGEQTQYVLQRVEKETEYLNSQVLPKDVKIHTFYDRSGLVELTTDTVEHNLLRGMILVLIVLMFFLVSVRAAINARTAPAFSTPPI